MKMWLEITLDFTPFYWIIEEILTNNKKKISDSVHDIYTTYKAK